MWMPHAVYRAFANLIDACHTEREDAVTDLKAANHAIAMLHTEYGGQIGKLRERLIAAEGAKRAALARADLLTIRCNQLALERDQLFAKVQDPTHKIAIVTPQIQMAPSIQSPGIDFEDIGDDRAGSEYADAREVTGDDVLERADAITGVVGQVYDPASALGSEQPRFGD